MVLQDEGRDGVKKTILVITDGHSNILNETTIPEADLARQDGIVVYVVGMLSENMSLVSLLTACRMAAMG